MTTSIDLLAARSSADALDVKGEGCMVNAPLFFIHVNTFSTIYLTYEVRYMMIAIMNLDMLIQLASNVIFP
jgi:hypothetical protein